MKDWIVGNLINSKNGNLIAKRCRVEWFVKHGFSAEFDNIVLMTDFLESDSPIPQRCYHIIHSITDKVKCKNKKCNDKFVNFHSFKSGYFDFCSNSCAQSSDIVKENHKNKNLNKYGVEHHFQSDIVKNKIKKTMLKRYGVENISTLESTKKQKMKTCTINHGVAWPMQSSIIRKKSKERCIDVYGVDNVLKNEKIRNKILNTRYLKYFERMFSDQGMLSDIVQPLFDINSFNGVGYYDIQYDWKCVRCENEFKDTLYNNIPRCEVCYPKQINKSLGEQQVSAFVSEIYTGKIILGDTTVLGGQELDIYLPDEKLAIEFNGVYWHSELNGKDKNYHINKTKKCEELGIRLIHIFETEWYNSASIIKSIIRYKLNLITERIFARNCEFRPVGAQLERDFLNKNHIQGYIPSSECYGLFDGNVLLMVISFGNSRFDSEGIEILRMASKINTSIVGGCSKLLSNYIKLNPVDKIITYANRRYGMGEVYTLSGLSVVSETPPSYFYTKSGKIYNRINFQKHKLKDKLELFDSNLTEWENMQLNGYDRIWDCGNIKYQYLYNIM